ncbi:MAG: ABC transporter substrate-binding protein [Geminicoccaceae bacterium]
MPLNRRTTCRLLAGLAALLACLPEPAAAADPGARKVVFGTNWRAQAEHGGFYQALATGLYAERGLDVEIREGGPQVNHRQLIAAGRLDFYMGGNLFGQFDFLREGIPVVTVAAIFQKEPQALLAHPGVGIDGLEDLAGRTLLIAPIGQLTFWPWLKATYGLKDEQIRPYTFNPAPFLADPNTVQQGYVTAEPFAIREAGGFDPVVLLLADAGYDSYSTLIQTRRELVDEHPEVVQAFVDASILGWMDYLYGDPAPGNALILEANPEMTPAQIAYSIEAMKAYGIVDSGDALELGVGAMTDARWASFFAKAVDWGIVEPDLPWRDGYTLEFVNRGVGNELRP